MPPIITTLLVRRKFDQYIVTFPTRRELKTVTTAASVSDEIWSLIKHYSEIKEKGVSLAAKHGITVPGEQQKAWLNFRANMRQAESYYQIAKETPTRSAALMYYYCFLNLVIGGMKIRHSKPFASNKPKHGIYFDSDAKGTLDSLTAKIGGGVFEPFYKDYFSAKPNRPPLKLSRLLGYCSDINVQYTMCGYGPGTLHPIYNAVFSDSTTKKTWNLIAIHSFNSVKPYKKSLASFLESYEQVDMPNQRELIELFDMNPWNAQYFTFFQTKVSRDWLGPDTPYPPGLLTNELAGVLGGLLYPNFYGIGHHALISEPYALKNQMSMDELCAIYIIMFSLSNLVRYNPAFLEKILESKDSWMIENFIQYTPETFLRAIVGWIIDVDYVFTRR